jgi:tetratricopeptide (TPR) repeat protein
MTLIDIEITNSSPTLCLNMIVKNESKIIKRLLESVLPIIDTYCICDTGSTDDTIEIVNSFFSDNNITGKIVFEPFKDFAHNRNFSLNACQGLSDYILFLDADMMLDIRNFDKNILSKYDCFNILQGNDVFYYQNMRIVKNDGLYSYVGVTHEYINTPKNCKRYSIPKEHLFIIDIGDGGSKSNKYERDINLLTKAIEEDPKNDRYHFYLANSYNDSGQYEKAIEYYKKRITLGGWEQEIWYSYYKIGNCYKNMDKMSDAICAWMEGYDFFPYRLEGLYEILKHYRYISKHKLAKIFYELCKNILHLNRNIDDYLFVNADVYKYKIHYELTVISCYIGLSNINDPLVVVLNNSNETGLNNNVLSNMKFYKDILQLSKLIKLDNATLIDVNGDDTIFYSSSSCLLPNKDKTGYLMNIRYVNYLINERGHYLNCDKHIITSNRFVELTSDFKVVTEKWFDLNYENRRYIGIEDIKIFNNKNSDNIIFVGTGYHKNDNIGIVMGEYDTNVNDNSNENKLLGHEYNHSSNNPGCEKNWVYVDYKDSLHIIYKWYPLEICNIDKESNKINLVENKKMPKIFSHARGSSCGFKYYVKDEAGEVVNTEVWFVVHVVSYEQPRHYYHMLVVFDEDLNLLRYSAPFKFEGEPIEYCLSVVVEDDRVLMNYSTWDRKTKIGIYDKKYIDFITKYNSY